MIVAVTIPTHPNSCLRKRFYWHFSFSLILMRKIEQNKILPTNPHTPKIQGRVWASKENFYIQDLHQHFLGQFSKDTSTLLAVFRAFSRYSGLGAQKLNFFAVEYSHRQKVECEAQLEGNRVLPQENLEYAPKYALSRGGGGGVGQC
jgi:hypothetical protein